MEGLADRLAHLKAVLRIPRKRGQHRRQGHFRFHAPASSRLSEQVSHHGARLHIVRFQPSLDRLGVEFQPYLHAIRLELLHLERSAAQDLARLLVLHQKRGCLVGARGRRKLAGEGDLFESRGR